MNGDYNYTYTTTSSAGAGAAMLVWLLIMGLYGLPTIIGMWKVFKKAGHPGWAAIVPLYNVYILIKIARRPEWWLLLFLLPCVSIVALFMLNIEVAKAFGKSAGFGIGLTLFPPLFYLLLGFGSAEYDGMGGQYASGYGAAPGYAQPGGYGQPGVQGYAQPGVQGYAQPGGYGQPGQGYANPASSAPAAGNAPEAGWHPDPYHQATWRYWDGSTWTSHTQ